MNWFEFFNSFGVHLFLDFSCSQGRISHLVLFKLKHKQTIQKIIAFFLLLVFFIITAPRIYFHDLVANHKDFSDCHQQHHSAVLHQQGVNCHFDDLVVTSPFVSLIEQPLLPLAIHFKKKLSAFSTLLIASFSQHKENRGPPCA